ncbi:MAG: TetR/AcrR family transcriptional regulator [Caulobacter sp.]|jgi:TetR/AcrR family transcriptional repressor of mexJK operon|nr:TetR/AcrR family transcriptional regulator [Caulobacter sp.]
MRPELHDQRREKVLAAARELFLAKGYGRATVAEVAKAARVAPATVYAYYDGKLALFRAVVDGAAQPFAGLFDHVDQSVDDVRTQLLTYAKAYFAFMSDPQVRAYYRIVSAEQPRHPELGAGLHSDVHRLLGAVLRGILERFVATGVLRMASLPIAARAFQGMVEHASLTISMLQGDDAAPLHPSQEYCEEVVRIFLSAYAVEN